MWAVRGSPPWDEELSLSLLDAGEERTFRSFRRAADRSRYLAAHTALRLLLAARLARRPADVVLGREPCAGCGGPHGRPVVLGDGGGAHFSLSHAPGLSLVALAGVPVGVDADRVPGPRTVELCLRRLHPQERRDAAAVPERELARWFCRLWTRKEAWLKACGTGLGRGLDRDYLGEREGPGAPPRPAGWTVRNLSCGPLDATHAAALAVPEGTPAPAAPCDLDWHGLRSRVGEWEAQDGRWAGCGRPTAGGGPIDIPTVRH
ncbi:4'-phosphopantetheinyl transferase [Streptomyces prasinopilosus]|uniref:4'-phosphopantetheinyl transferase n=1 Tax=Streptomyces prasinopilosus TaxID=67344 RepID=A0A1G6ZTX6_9ACTN|nr:4'-phosphopantetheinyl transferase [Streptomyces prasinopilosus]